MMLMRACLLQTMFPRSEARLSAFDRQHSGQGGRRMASGAREHELMEKMLREMIRLGDTAPLTVRVA